MKVGIDTFTIREFSLDAFQTLDFIAEHGLEGAQFGGMHGLSAGLDLGELREVRAYAESLGLYTHVSVPGCNPCLIDPAGLAAHREATVRDIALAAQCGWHELHSSLGGGLERYEHPVPWTEHLARSAEYLRGLAPVLREHGSRIDLETHGDTTTFELVRLIEDVGPDVVGICLDTANVLCHAEDPVRAAKRAAPYTHLTHTKDGIIYFAETGYTRQGKTPGEGCLDWPRILQALGEFAPDLPLSIEDHKWLFTFDVFEADWLRLHPDVTCEEYGDVMRLAWQCERRIRAGEIPDPDEYEAIPFAEQAIDRLHSGRDYLKSVLGDLGLRGE